MRDILTKSYLWLCMFLCFYIPFIPVVHALSSIVMGLLVVIAFFIVEKPKAKMIFVNRTTTAFIILFLIIALQSLFGNHFVNDFAELRKIGQTVLLIILFSIIKSPQLLKDSFIAGTVLSSAISLARIIIYMTATGSTAFYTGEIVEELMMTQRLYLGFFSVIALIFCAEGYFSLKNKKRKTIYLCLTVFLLSTIFFIASRTAIILSLIVLISITMYKLKSKARIGVLLVIMVLGIGGFLGNNNLSQRALYKADDYRESFVEKIKAHEPRYLIWKYSFAIFNENPHKVFGVGFGETQQLLRRKYQEIQTVNKRNWFLTRDFNTHNQYLDFLVSYGIFGLALFLVFLSFLFFNAKDSIYSLNLFFTLTIFMLFENTFHRTFGVFIIALIICCILGKAFIKHPEK